MVIIDCGYYKMLEDFYCSHCVDVTNNKNIDGWRRRKITNYNRLIKTVGGGWGVRGGVGVGTTRCKQYKGH